MQTHLKETTHCISSQRRGKAWQRNTWTLPLNSKRTHQSTPSTRAVLWWHWLLNDKTYGNSKRTWDTVEQIGDDERLDGEVALGQAQTKAGEMGMVKVSPSWWWADDDQLWGRGMGLPGWWQYQKKLETTKNLISSAQTKAGERIDRGFCWKFP